VARPWSTDLESHAHWLLLRRGIADSTEIAYYVCYGPRRCTLLDLAWIAGMRWRVEECFQQAKGETGLDHYQVRSWRSWYAHITLSMLAHAWLVVARIVAAKGEPVPAPGHDRLYVTGGPPAADQAGPARPGLSCPYLVLVGLVSTTSVPGPAQSLQTRGLPTDLKCRCRG
jgi:hypothetical protein